MARPKRWYNPEAALSVRVVPRSDRDESFNMPRWRHPRVAPSLVECLIYPLTDGPGLGLLVFFPPILWVFSLPIFDIIAVLQPLTKERLGAGLMVVPVMVPVVFSFSMTFGYALLFLGHVLVSSALGENDHPDWPEWHPADIAEGICRWFWAALFGVAIGGGPLALYWMHCGDIDVVRLGRLFRADHAGCRLCPDGAGGVAPAREYHRRQSRSRSSRRSCESAGITFGPA